MNYKDALRALKEVSPGSYDLLAGNAKPTKKSSSWASKPEIPAKKKKKKEEEEKKVGGGGRSLDDIAPSKDEGLDFFQKGAFEDGFQMSDVPKVILGTVGDAGLNAVKGLASLGEGIGDLAMYGVAAVADSTGGRRGDEYAKKIREKASVNKVEEMTKGADEWLNQYSILGNTSDAMMQGLGQVGGILLTGGLGAAGGLGVAGTTALTTGVMGLSGTGSGISEAYQDGANDLQALKHGLNSGAADAISELIFGGLGKAVKAVGFSKGLSSADDMLAKLVGSKFKNQTAKNIVEFGIKSGAEGLEEVLAGLAQGYSKYHNYLEEQGMSLEDVLKDENLLEQFIVGMGTSGMIQSGYVPGFREGSVAEANKKGQDFITGYTQNEQAVIDREVEKRVAEAEKNGTKVSAKEKDAIIQEVQRHLDKGYISIDTIEETLGGKDYEDYKKAVEWEDSLQKQYDTLSEEYQDLYERKGFDKSSKDFDREAELKEKLPQLKKQLDNVKATSTKGQLRQALWDNTLEKAKGDRLVESYLEVVRKKQDFQVDMSKYKNETARKTLQNIIDSGLANNSNEFHDFVDLMTGISEGRGIEFHITDTDGLKGTEHYKEGFITDGFYIEKDGSITINLDSPKALNFLVGHEVTHSLEKSEFYKGLQDAVFQYAKDKGELEQFQNSVNERYSKLDDRGKKKEVTSDLIGRYLFTDYDFISSLSTKNRNVFQKVYDEIKYLCKLATAGSKAYRDLERVRHQFEKAWREASKGNANATAQHSLSLTADQQKNFDYNQNKADVGSPLKTLKGSAIKRSSKYGVGKEIRGEIYVHKQYAGEVVPSDVLSQAEELLAESNPDFKYNAIKYNPKTGVVAFQEAPDFDTAREPVVGDYVSVNTNTGAVKNGHSNYIWHHKWNWVKNDYKGFDVEESWNWSKQWLNTLTEVSDGNGIARWNAQLDKFGLPHDGKTSYSLTPVKPVEPKSDKWQRGHTEAWFREQGYPIYRDVSEEQAQANEETNQASRDGKHGTQIAGTKSTYKQLFEIIQSEHPDNWQNMRILDASSGLGLGTRLGRNMGFNVTDIEPYPSQHDYMYDKEEEGDVNPHVGELQPDYTDYTQLQKEVASGETEGFDYIVSNAVLNVIPQDTRDNLVDAMGSLLKPGGQMFINVISRNYDGAIKSVPEIQRNAKGIPTGYVRTAEGDYSTKGNITGRGHETFVWKSNSVQKVFSYNELVAYLEDALGDGFTVTPYKKIGMTAALVTKDASDAQYSLTKDTEGNKLTQEQKRQFKDTKTVDENGNLKVLYHGSRSEAFTEFDLYEGVWLTTDPRYAEVYAGQWHSWRDDAFTLEEFRRDLNGLEPDIYSDPDYRVYKMYANIKNPADIGELDIWLSDDKVRQLARALGMRYTELKPMADTYMEEYAYMLTRSNEFIELAKSKGFDGFKATEKGKETWCAFASPDQVKLTTNASPTENPDIRYSLTEETDKTYLDAVNRGDTATAQKMVDEIAEKAGYSVRGHHGTTNLFYVFDTSKSNIENDWGRGIYATTSEEDAQVNYASEDGADLNHRIERLAEMMEYWDEYEDMDYEQRVEAARQQLSQGMNKMLNVAFRMENPVIVERGTDGTFFTYESGYDEDLDEYSEPSGTLVDVIEQMKDIIYEDYEWASYDADKLDNLYEEAMDWGGLSATELKSSVSDWLVDVSDEDGNIASNEILREALERMGFDGIVDNTVAYKFGALSGKRFGGMQGVEEGTTHYIAFNSSQVKLTDPVTYDDSGNVIPLSQRFNAENKDIRYSLSEEKAEVVDGIAVATNVAEIMKSPEYSKPKDYMAQYSVSTAEEWKKSYLKRNSGDEAEKVALAIMSFTNKMVQDDAVRGYVPMGNYKTDKMGPLRKNQEYIWTFDMDTSCPRTFQFLNFRDAIQRKAGRYLTYNESINLLELMRAYGQQIPCCYCYVENKRVLLSASYNNFFGFRNNVMNAVTEEDAAKAMYGYNEKKGLPDASKKALARWRSDMSYNPSLTEVWTATNTARNSVLNFLDGEKSLGLINEKTPESRLNKLVLDEFGISDKGAVAEIEGFVKDWTYDTLANIPHIYNIDNDASVSVVDEKALALNHEALAYAKSASSAKSVENYVPYTDQLKNVSEEDREYILGMGGIRKHSSNDFRMDYVQDYFLFYADLAAGKWTGHTYTKSSDFVKIFAGTGDRINMSVAFYEDADGTLRENLDEGASWRDAQELRKAYKNVGSMAMVTSDNQLSYALNSDWVDMIIPFHASGLDKSVWYNLRMWNDYTSKQGERFYNADTMKRKLKDAGVEIPKGANAATVKSLFEETFQIKHIYGKNGEVVKPHFFPGDTQVNGQTVPGHHNNVETYFKLCEEYGVHPRFYGIKVTDSNGNQIDATEHPSYLKLIKETSRTDTPQEVIQFNFGNYDDYLKMTPFEYAMQRLKEEANNGGFENTKADPYGVVKEFTEEYLDKNRPLGYLTERAKETREILLEMGRETARQQKKALEGTSYSLSKDNGEYGTYNIYGKDVKKQDIGDIAPMMETAEPQQRSEVMGDFEAEDEHPIDMANSPVLNRMNQKLTNTQTELAKNQKLREESRVSFDEKIATAQAQLDAKKNKDTKVANNLKRRIERLERLKADRDAEYAKRIGDIKGRIIRAEDEIQKYHPGLDRAEQTIARIDRVLEMDKQELTNEYNQNLEQLKNRDAYISRRATELYNEIRKLKKGVRASEQLGYLLDHGYEWSSIKAALINIKHTPGETVNINSEAESVAREMLNDDYEQAHFNLDSDYQQKLNDLESEAETKKQAARVANQRIAKNQEYAEQMESLIGDTTTWVDKKMGISYKTSTLRRNLRDIVRDAEGNRDIAKADAIYDELQGKYNRHEAMLNREANRIKGAYADLKITSAEDAYIQMLGELRHNPDTTLTEDVVSEYYEKHKRQIDTDKVDKIIQDARATYDTLLQRVNKTLREQGMKEIPYRQGYFPHFTEPKQSWLAKLLNWKTKDFDIPTDIAGLTENFNPNRSWQSFNKERKSDITDYSFMKGMDTYVQGALDWIYHIEDIQKRRAFENHIRYVHSEKGVKDRIDALRKNQELDADELQEQIDLVYKEAGNPLNNFVTDFRAGTNTLANKKSSLDRVTEELSNRKFYSTMTNLSNRVTGNMVAGSISSALTNFIPITQSWMEVSPVSSLRAMGDTIKSTFRDDGTIEKSDFLTNRLRQSESLFKTNWDKVSDKVGFLMEAIDSFTSQTVWRSKYLENISNGMSESEAIKNADQFAENVIAGRSRGNMPTIFDAKSPIIKTLTAFQLEVNNQYQYMFKDVPQDMSEESKAKLVKGYATAFLGAYVYNALYSSLVGRDAAFDPIDIIADLLKDIFGGDDDEEKDVADIVIGFTDSVLEEVPFVGGLLGGGRIPISSALPYDGLYEAFKGTVEDVSEGDWKGLTKEWLNPLWYLAMPLGGGQIRKTVQGLSMFNEEHPISGSYTDSGSLRYPVEDTFGNKLQAAMFGQYASSNARYYFDNDLAPLNEKQIQEYMDVDIPIRDYWDYRQGLKGLSKLGEKVDYIDSLDLPIDKKNLLVNNIANRDEPIDMSNYGSYGSFEEFEFAKEHPDKYIQALEFDSFDQFYRHYKALNKLDTMEEKAQYLSNQYMTIDKKNILINSVTNRKEPIDLTGYDMFVGTIGKQSFEEFEYAKKNPEKYEFLKSLGVSYDEYDALDEKGKEAYTWAFKNPEGYILSRAVTNDLMEYRKYTNALYNIKADKDQYGKSISGTRKTKVLDYLNNSDMDYYAKLILFKSEYNADDTYNYEIIDYLNGRNDLTYQEKVTILLELGFRVDSNGNISW